jgi:hypothetical protein
MKVTRYFAVGSFVALAACSTDATTSDVGTVRQATTEDPCHNPDGYYGMMASLAVAMANELGQWEGTTYLENGGYRNMRLTEAAKTRCQSRERGDCFNTQAILDMQNVDYIENPDGQRVFDGTQFYQQLQVYLDRQRIIEGRSGSDGCQPGPHELTILDLTLGTCAIDYTYEVTMDGHPSTLECKLKYVGWPENPWLDFRSTDTTVTIDPGAGMVEDEPSTDPTCNAAYTVYDPDLNELGTECCPDGFSEGTLELSSWNDSTLICTW